MIAPAPNATLSPGTYWAEHERGRLILSDGVDGSRHFELNAWGARDAVCAFKGRVDNDKGYDEELRGPPACVLQLQARDAAVAVSSPTPAACRGGCGALADFVDVYYVRPALCGDELDSLEGSSSEPTSRRTARALLARYEAYAAICERFMDRTDRDRLLNGKATVQFQLADDAGCVATLEKTASLRSTEQEMVRAMGRYDFNAFRDTWQAIQDRFRQCTRAAGRRRSR